MRPPSQILKRVSTFRGKCVKLQNIILPYLGILNNPIIDVDRSVLGRDATRSDVRIALICAVPCDVRLSSDFNYRVLGIREDRKHIVLYYSSRRR